MPRASTSSHGSTTRVGTRVRVVVLGVFVLIWVVVQAGLLLGAPNNVAPTEVVEGLRVPRQTVEVFLSAALGFMVVGKGKTPMPARIWAMSLLLLGAALSAACVYAFLGFAPGLPGAGSVSMKYFVDRLT